MHHDLFQTMFGAWKKLRDCWLDFKLMRQHFETNMHPDSKLLTDAQRRKLCEMMYAAFLEIRTLGGSGKAEQAGDLADAFHNLPNDMWHDDFSLKFFRDAFLVGYQKKYPVRMVRDYVKMVDEIIGMRD